MCAQDVERKARCNWARGCSKCELESAHTTEQLLASERLLEERQQTIERLLVDKQELLREKTELLSGLLKGAKKMPPLISESDESVLQGSETDERVQSLDEQPSDSEHNEDDSKDSVKRNPRLVQPPGFKEIRSRVGKFSGRRGDDDFNLWLTDYEEATEDFSWNDEVRVKWFSWFVEGPVKATW